MNGKREWALLEEQVEKLSLIWCWCNNGRSGDDKLSDNINIEPGPEQSLVLLDMAPTCLTGTYSHIQKGGINLFGSLLLFNWCWWILMRIWWWRKRCLLCLCRHSSCFRCRWRCWINTSTPPLSPYAYWWYWWWSRGSHERRHICQRAPARCECSNASNLIGICKAGVFQCPKFEKSQCLEEDTLKKCCWLRPGKGVSMSQMREALCLWACIFKTR